MVDFRPEKADFRAERAWGRMDGRTIESPPVFFRTSSPFGAAALLPLQFTIMQSRERGSLTTYCPWATCSPSLSPSLHYFTKPYHFHSRLFLFFNEWQRSKLIQKNWISFLKSLIKTKKIVAQHNSEFTGMPFHSLRFEYNNCFPLGWLRITFMQNSFRILKNR